MNDVPTNLSNNAATPVNLRLPDFPPLPSNIRKIGGQQLQDWIDRDFKDWIRQVVVAIKQG